jgi:hypothetical protein
MSRNFGIIVDGPGDFDALRARFKEGFKILKTDAARGHTVPISQIVAGSKRQIAILRNYNCDVVIVVTDFEARMEPYELFREKLQEQFDLEDFGIVVKVACPNQMIENWYLSDIEAISRGKAFVRSGLRQKNYEGTNGKVVLKSLFEKNITYNEKRHGPELFGAIRFSVGQLNSESLRHFLSIVEDA